jgi:hypothetical protein
MDAGSSFMAFFLILQSKQNLFINQSNIFKHAGLKLKAPITEKGCQEKYRLMVG